MAQGQQDPRLSAALDRLKRDFPGYAADIGPDMGGRFEAVIWEKRFPFPVVASANDHETDAAALDGALDTLATRRAAEALS